MKTKRWIVLLGILVMVLLITACADTQGAREDTDTESGGESEELSTQVIEYRDLWPDWVAFETPLYDEEGQEVSGIAKENLKHFKEVEVVFKNRLYTAEKRMVLGIRMDGTFIYGIPGKGTPVINDPRNPTTSHGGSSRTTMTADEYQTWYAEKASMCPENYITPEEIAAELSLGALQTVEFPHSVNGMYGEFTYTYVSEGNGTVCVRLQYLPGEYSPLKTSYENGTIEGTNVAHTIILQYGCPESLFPNGYDIRSIVHNAEGTQTRYLCFDPDVIYTYQDEDLYRMHFRSDNISVMIYPDTEKPEAFFAQDSVEPFLSYLTVAEFSQGFAARARAAA